MAMVAGMVVFFEVTIKAYAVGGRKNEIFSSPYSSFWVFFFAKQWVFIGWRVGIAEKNKGFQRLLEALVYAFQGLLEQPVATCLNIFFPGLDRSRFRLLGLFLL
jgi:hypothetical protein